MKLVHVLSGLEVGGKERVVLDLALRARQAGWDAHLCLFDTPFRDEERDFDPGEVPVEFLRRGPGLDWRFALALARHLKEQGFEVVHAHNDTALFYCGLAGLRLGRARPRIVATFHTRPGHATRGARWLTRWASRRMDGITAVSEDLRSFLLETGWVARCDTLWNGVDLETFTPEGGDGGWRGRLGLGPGSVLVVHIGRHDQVKRQVDLVRAARELGTRDGTVHFVLVGRGPLSASIEAEARGLSNVSLLPRVHDVPALLRAADLFVLCSVQEAAPRVLLEALASGRAVVATDVGGCRRILTDEQGRACGELVPPGDPERLARALQILAADPERRKRLGELARRRAAAFSVREEWERYCALWQGLTLGGAGPRHAGVH